MKVGLDGTHRGWLRFQFSYCSENCIAINCCTKNHLPAVSCDPIMQWATRCGLSLLGWLLKHLLIITLHLVLGILQMRKDGAFVQTNKEVPIPDIMA